MISLILTWIWVNTRATFLKTPNKQIRVNETELIWLTWKNISPVFMTKIVIFLSMTCLYCRFQQTKLSTIDSSERGVYDCFFSFRLHLSVHLSVLCACPREVNLWVVYSPNTLTDVIKLSTVIRLVDAIVASISIRNKIEIATK